MTIWRKLLQFINVMLVNRSSMIVAEWGLGRMTYAKKTPLQRKTCASSFSTHVINFVFGHFTAVISVVSVSGNLHSEQGCFTFSEERAPQPKSEYM